MKGTKIDFETWRRRDLFAHYMQNLKCVLSLTADVDVTALVAHCRGQGVKFFPGFLYILSKVVNSREEFRMGYDGEGDPVVWDTVFPSYIVFHPEDERFTRLISEFTPDPGEFYRTVAADMERHGDRRGLEIEYGYRNTFDVSCLPWLYYKSLDMHVFDSGTYLAPVVTWGRFIQREERFVMPLSLQIHHAVADGFHISRFFLEMDEALQCSGNFYSMA